MSRNRHKPRATNSRHIQTTAYRSPMSPTGTAAWKRSDFRCILRCDRSGSGTFADPTQKSKRAVMRSIWNVILKNWTDAQAGNTVVSACAINNEMKSRTSGYSSPKGTAQDEQTTTSYGDPFLSVISVESCRSIANTKQYAPNVFPLYSVCLNF